MMNPEKLDLHSMTCLKTDPVVMQVKVARKVVSLLITHSVRKCNTFEY
jgi:hypothetical protein